ncbi:SpoIIE family protein phosphatase [Desulfolutivibrio sulfoxidireducens]|uniref:SpoIIE family protein phosphatase n=1 Tax=Desulfolutivibrio sulfoxidireducens TaxID=2773299 RepID=UPI00159E76AB|nr:SpoIIE family protein phosphatase [Desulfolutivibrio sulfoxidireducens]QLA17474.1 SpoIIE family protein phosphatase [Desulfolutivibrio sulfoxidireducens]
MSHDAPPARPTASGLTEHGVTVLLVDDQAMIGEAVRRMLAPEADIAFHFCQDPAKALHMAAELSPTIILQDLVMPGIDGLTLVKFFRAHPTLRDVPLIVLSTKEEPATKAEAFARGASDYLVKLPDRIELVARIRHHSKGYINLLQRNEAYEALLTSQKALAAELSQAAEYVMSLLPAPLAEGDIRTNWSFVPSAQLGGDIFGYHDIDPDHFALYLLDVCSHGVGPALLSVQAHNMLKTQTLPGVDFHDPSQVLRGLNDTFPMEAHNNLYFTIWYGVYQRSTRRLVFANAGHPPAVLLPPGGGAVDLISSNLMIGAMPEIAFKSGECEVPPGSRLFVFSDGVYEVAGPGRVMWTYDEYRDYLAGLRPSQGDEIARVLAYVRERGGCEVLDDDFSLVKVVFA